MKLGRIKPPPFLIDDRPQATRSQIMSMFVVILDETPEYIRVKSRIDGNVSCWFRQGRSDYYVESDGP